MVIEGFSPKCLSRVLFYGENRLGVFEEILEVTKGSFKHPDIIDAILRNVTVSDNNLVEDIDNYINNYTIGDSCFISSICIPETTGRITYGEGNTISVLNEVDDGNVVLFRELNNQLAVFMVQYFQDEVFKNAILRPIKESMALNESDQTWIGNRVKAMNTKKITNTITFNDRETNGASRLSDCTIFSSEATSVYIGTGIICENSVTPYGFFIINSVKVQDCFVGETYQIINGFTAPPSILLTNSYMANGRTCATFCDPSPSSHHESSLLISGILSFCNAGLATNFNNHVYKVEPMYYGVLQRGCKTTSGAYLLMPANVGIFSICFGKLIYHPNTHSLPFSYPIAYSDIVYLSPGRNIATANLYGDINKWPKRDLRPQHSQESIINFDWLSPFSVGRIVEGKKILEKLHEASGGDVSAYNYHEYVINASSLRKGTKHYNITLHIYMGAILKRVLREDPVFTPSITTIGTGKWIDPIRLLPPVSEKERLISGVKNGELEMIDDVLQRLTDINGHCQEHQRTRAYELIKNYYQLDTITLVDADRIRTDYIKARRAWVAEIRKNTEKESVMDGVEQNLPDNSIGKLGQEGEHEN